MLDHLMNIKTSSKFAISELLKRDIVGLNDADKREYQVVLDEMETANSVRDLISLEKWLNGIYNKTLNSGMNIDILNVKTLTDSSANFILLFHLQRAMLAFCGIFQDSVGLYS